MDKVWIVMPAYNEEKNIGKTIDSVKREGFNNIVIVDDGSRDKTYEKALSKGVWVLKHEVNLGQGAALQTGIDFALKNGAEIIITFDSDGQHSAKEIKDFVKKINEGYDVVLGSRFLKKNKIPTSRKIALKIGILFTSLVSHIRLTDTHNGFRAFSRKAAETIRIKMNDMAHASEILDEIAKHKLKYAEVPVTIKYDKNIKGQPTLNSIRIALKMIAKKLIFG